MTQNNSIFPQNYNGPSYVSAKWLVPISIGVYEDTVNKRVLFPAAGYTKPVTYYPGHDKKIDGLLKGANGANRQVVIHDMLNSAIAGMPIHGTAQLIQEPQNPYDAKAIQVIAMLRIGEVLSLYPIGYVPERLNSYLIEHWAKLEHETAEVSILKDDKGYLVPMVSVKYDLRYLPRDNRFSRLQYE